MCRKLIRFRESLFVLTLSSQDSLTNISKFSPHLFSQSKELWQYLVKYINIIFEFVFISKLSSGYFVVFKPKINLDRHD